MSSSLTLRKATRQKTKIRVGISGPSGSGKTFSALMLASGIAPWNKIAVIDTENGSGELYSHVGDYNVITLTAPFTPERYTEAIQECEKAGMEVIIIDSVTHEWDGKGGCLESNELMAQTKFKGNTWSAWSATTPRHQKFIASIIGSSCHIITTARSKTDTIQTDDKKIKKVGMKEIQRDGFEYELTINFTLDRDGHYATASKDRTEMFSEVDPFKITADTGKKILAWTMQGTEPVKVEEKPIEPKPKPTTTKVMEIMANTKTPGTLEVVYHQALTHEWSKEELADLAECYLNNYTRVMAWLRTGTDFISPEGVVVASAKFNEKGKASVVLAPKEPTEAEIAAAERAGMQAA